MTLAAITGMPIIAVGHANRQGTASLAALSTTILDAANEAASMIGELRWEDGGTHTVDTTGSSSIQWRTSTVTFANAGSTFKVGIGAVSGTAVAGPIPVAANTADVIAFDVAAVFTGGGGGVTTAAWQTSVPTTGSKTIANGALVAVSMQMTARAGVDSILVSTVSSVLTNVRPTVSTFTNGSYANGGRLPNVVVVASDGTRGYIYGGFVASVGPALQTWNNTSSTKEFGNILRFPFPVRAFGIVIGAGFTGNCDLILYSNPLGTPAAAGTASVDLNQVSTTNTTSDGRFMFASPIDLAANTDYAVIAKPTSATNVTLFYKTYNDANHQNSDWLGTDCYAINRNTGAFASQNSNKDRYSIGLLIGAFDNGTIYPRSGLHAIEQGMAR